MGYAGADVDVPFLSGGLEAARMLSAIVDHAESAIIAKDRHGVILAWSPSAERLFGYAARDAIGRHITIVIPVDRHHEEAEIMARLRAGEVIRRFETERQRRDGSLVPVELTITPIRSDTGELAGAVKIARDLTERRRAEAALEAEESRFRTLADNISQLAWMADPRGDIFWYNRRWFEYTGTTLEEVRGWGWRRVHHPDHVDRVVTRLQHSWDSGEPWEDTFPIRGHDGQYRWFLSRALPIRDADGRIVRWFGTNTDVTDQRRLEAALAESNERKDAFLATLSHELRNPLGAIRTATAALQSAGGDRAFMDRALAIVGRQCAHVSRLLDDLLDVSRIAHDRMVLQVADVDVAAALRDTEDAMRPVLEGAGLTFEVRRPAGAVPARIDAVRVQQIAGNLLANAAKFTPAGGTVTLALTADDDAIVIEVADTGIGLAADEIEPIFQLFVQGGGHRGGGLGIGLSLVRRLAELHGGSAVAASPGRGGGSTFTVRLPRGFAATPGSPAADTAASTSHRHVLIVDDDTDNAEAFAMLLRLRGHAVTLAASAGLALDAAATRRPDVVLLDLGLPDLDGFETCRRLRAAGHTGPIVAVTGWGQPEDRARTKAAGFDRHLAKPVDPKEVVRIVEATPSLAGSR